MNTHCGKHDKIVTDHKPCEGCETDRNLRILGPDDTLAELRSPVTESSTQPGQGKPEGSGATVSPAKK